jgi:hypothetical protein
LQSTWLPDLQYSATSLLSMKGREKFCGTIILVLRHEMCKKARLC